ncbi:MAG: stage II sporulation protein M [Bacilli bacterium]|nr:stage II sporulation protein M [Bacilli bacterium]
MSKYKLTKDRLFVYICCLYLVGIFFGIFLFRKNNYELNFAESNFFKMFCANYWYLFLMWLFGFSAIGLFFNSFIIFFRGFLLGALITVLVRLNLKETAIMLALEIIVFIPVFFTLSYFSLTAARRQLYNFFSPLPSKLNNKVYLNIMILVTIAIVIYCLIIVIYC